MKFYTKQHQYYCGIDLHARTMYVCILDQTGHIVVERNMASAPEPFLTVIAPYREDIVIGVECIFTWYWLAALCAREKLGVLLGHALYMKAIHGGKAKNDRIDAHKIAVLMRGGLFPEAYVYPAAMRATRDLMRRRNHLMRKRAELIAHIQNTNSQYNLPEFGKRVSKKHERVGIAEKFPDADVQKVIELDCTLIDYYDDLLPKLERHILACAKEHDPKNLSLLQTIPGIGMILALIILYEIHDITRFPRVQDFMLGVAVSTKCISFLTSATIRS